MEWRDQGVLLSVRKHAETSVIIEVLSSAHGRHLGVVRGGTSRKIAPILQPGAQLDLRWRARLSVHLGAFTVELLKSRAAQVMQDPLALAGLNAVTALLGFCLAERDEHPQFYHQTKTLFDMLGQSDAWPLAYLRWEMALLDETGFGLDLARCAVTGSAKDLAFVSPKTGRAVSRTAAGEWATKLLPLPGCMLDIGQNDLGDVATALTTTGFFLRRRLAPQLGHQNLPAARQRLVDFLSRQG